MLYLFKYLKSLRFYQRWSTYIPFLFYTLFILIILNISFPLKSTKNYHHTSHQHNYVDDNSIGDALIEARNNLFYDSGGGENSGGSNNVQDGNAKIDDVGGNRGSAGYAVNRRKVNNAALEYSEKLKKNRNELLEKKEIETIILSNSKTEASTMLKMAFKK